MKQWWMKRSLNERLAWSAFVLGALALAATPYRGGRTIVDAQELAREMADGSHRITSLELAGRIIEGQGSVRLLDLRPSAAFEQYHIPTAVNLPLDRLADNDIGRDEKVVVYGASDIEAAQAWVLLRAQGHRGIVVLDGALPGWRAQVLSPVLPTGDSADARGQSAKIRAICAYFGGNPRLGDQTVAEALVPVAPAVAAPPSTPKKDGKPAPAKKKEGC